MAHQVWITFCISTFKRPVLLKKQLTELARQTFQDFEVVVSDNDPEASAREIVAQFDSRFHYFHNEDNLGMIRSFNNSVERAATTHVVMVTDDDPVDKDFLKVFNELWLRYPDYSFYGGIERIDAGPDAIEIIPNKKFLAELLDPRKTGSFLWSSCVLRRDHVLKAGGIPDYGSPHLADHVLLVKVGAINGGMFLNHVYSTLASHDHNFSKFNFNYYVKGCEGFYKCLQDIQKNENQLMADENAVLRHLKVWFIGNMFSLLRYYTISKKDPEKIKEIKSCAETILKFDFMKHCSTKYRIKLLIFSLKKMLGKL